MEEDDDIFITRVSSILEDEELNYFVEEYELVSNILDYYKKYGKISEKQKYCLCRAIAEVDCYYNEMF